MIHLIAQSIAKKLIAINGLRREITRIQSRISAIAESSMEGYAIPMLHAEAQAREQQISLLQQQTARLQRTPAFLTAMADHQYATLDHEISAA